MQACSSGPPNYTSYQYPAILSSFRGCGSMSAVDFQYVQIVWREFIVYERSGVLFEALQLHLFSNPIGVKNIELYIFQTI